MAIPEYIARLRKHVGHEMLWLPSVSGIVVDRAGRLLLGRRADTGAWSVPSGFVEPGEQPAAAVVREVWEETGVRVVPERVCAVRSHPITYPNGDECEFLNVAFRCRPVADAARVNDDESVAVDWFAPDALPELDEHGRVSVGHALADRPEAWFAPVPG